MLGEHPVACVWGEQLVDVPKPWAARLAGAMALLVAAVALPARPAAAIEIELRDFAPDRVERQRAYQRGEMPLPATPDLKNLDARLAARGLARGQPIYIRIFKASSELEVWMQKGDRFELLDTYPICHWTGTLGPKLKEGDKQSPEGFYSVTSRQMRLVGRWQKAFNLGFPNAYDQHAKRTGSFILVHGGCSSVGCYAMTEQVQEEIYALANAAIKGGQQRFHVHVFPFRMTPLAMDVFSGHTWLPFWSELKAGYDSFERTRIPPRVGLCGERYHVTDGERGETGDTSGLVQLPRSACTAATIVTSATSTAGSATQVALQQSKPANSESEERPSRRKKSAQRNQSRIERSGLGAATPASSVSVKEDLDSQAARSSNDIQNGFADSARKVVNRQASGG